MGTSSLGYVLMISAGIIGALAATDAPTAGEPSWLEIKTYLSGAPSEHPAGGGLGGVSGEFRVVRSEKEWQVLRSELPPSLTSGLAAPDFSKIMMLVAALGERRTAGYSVTIHHAAYQTHGIEVSVLESQPGPHCLSGASLTYPIEIVLVPRRDVPVRFLISRAIADCKYHRTVIAR